MRLVFAIFILILVSIASSWLVRQFGWFPAETAATIDPAVLFVREPVFRLSCDPEASPSAYREVLAAVGSRRPLPQRCGEAFL